MNNDCIEYERNGDKNRNLSIDEYLSKTELYLRNIIISLQNYDTWKILLTILINFISLKYSQEKRVSHSSNDSIKLTTDSDRIILLKYSLSDFVKIIRIVEKL